MTQTETACPCGTAHTVEGFEVATSHGSLLYPEWVVGISFNEHDMNKGVVSHIYPPQFCLPWSTNMLEEHMTHDEEHRISYGIPYPLGNDGGWSQQDDEEREEMVRKALRAVAIWRGDLLFNEPETLDPDAIPEEERWQFEGLFDNEEAGQ